MSQDHIRSAEDIDVVPGQYLLYILHGVFISLPSDIIHPGGFCFGHKLPTDIIHPSGFCFGHKFMCPTMNNRKKMKKEFGSRTSGFIYFLLCFSGCWGSYRRDYHCHSDIAGSLKNNLAVVRTPKFHRPAEICSIDWFGATPFFTYLIDSCSSIPAIYCNLVGICWSAGRPISDEPIVCVRGVKGLRAASLQLGADFCCFGGTPVPVEQLLHKNGSSPGLTGGTTRTGSGRSSTISRRHAALY